MTGSATTSTSAGAAGSLTSGGVSWLAYGSGLTAASTAGSSSTLPQAGLFSASAVAGSDCSELATKTSWDDPPKAATESGSVCEIIGSAEAAGKGSAEALKL